MKNLHEQRMEIAEKYVSYGMDISATNSFIKGQTKDPFLLINETLTSMTQNKLKITGDEKLKKLAEHGVVFNVKKGEDSQLAYETFYSPVLAMKSDGVLIKHCIIRPFEGYLIYTDKNIYSISQVKTYDTNLSKILSQFDMEAKRNKFVNWDKLVYRMFRFEHMTKSQFSYEVQTPDLFDILDDYELTNNLGDYPDSDNVDVFLDKVDKSKEYIEQYIKENYRVVILMPNMEQFKVYEVATSNELYSNTRKIGIQLENIMYEFNDSINDNSLYF